MGSSLGGRMRVFHRYLGFFLAGIMAVYAISGVVLIFRDGDTFKSKVEYNQKLKPNLGERELGETIGIKRFKIDKVENDVVYFDGGTYNSSTGKAEYFKMELPYVLNKMVHLHKAKSSQPLYVLNIIFGLSLLFFVISSFWMFMPGTDLFKKGMIFTAIGFVLALVLMLV